MRDWGLSGRSQSSSLPKGAGSGLITCSATVPIGLAKHSPYVLSKAPVLSYNQLPSGRRSHLRVRASEAVRDVSGSRFNGFTTLKDEILQ